LRINTDVSEYHDAYFFGIDGNGSNLMLKWLGNLTHFLTHRRCGPKECAETSLSAYKTARNESIAEHGL